MYEIERIENWSEKRGKLKDRYSGLSDEDLDYTEGKEDELVDRLHVATGKKREEIMRELHKL